MMNLSAILIEIAVMLIGFTVLVFGMLLMSPLTFISDYPPEIQAAYYRSQHKEATKEKLTKLMFAKKLIALLFSCFCLLGCCIWQEQKPFGGLFGQWADALALVRRNM